MAGMTRYLERKVQQYWAQKQQLPEPPDTVYLSLHNTNPGNSPDGSTEVSADGYDRAAVEGGSAWQIIGGDNPTVVRNTSSIQYGEAVEPWGNIRYFVIWDGPTKSDNPLFVGELNTVESVEAGFFPSHGNETLRVSIA